MKADRDTADTYVYYSVVGRSLRLSRASVRDIMRLRRRRRPSMGLVNNEPRFSVVFHFRRSICFSIFHGLFECDLACDTRPFGPVWNHLLSVSALAEHQLLLALIVSSGPDLSWGRPIYQTALIGPGRARFPQHSLASLLFQSLFFLSLQDRAFRQHAFGAIAP